MAITLLDQFYRELFIWSLNDGAREVSEDYPLTRSMTCNPDAVAFLTYVNNKSLDDRLLITKCAVAQTFINCGVLPKGAFDEGTELYNTYMALRRGLAKYAGAFGESLAEGPKGPDIKPALLFARLAASLSPILGDNYKKSGARSFTFETRVGDLILITGFDIARSGTPIKLRYFHQFDGLPALRLRGLELPWFALINLMIGAKQTEIILTSEGALPHAIKSLEKESTHLLSGLQDIMSI